MKKSGTLLDVDGTYRVLIPVLIPAISYHGNHSISEPPLTQAPNFRDTEYASLRTDSADELGSDPEPSRTNLL